MKTASLVTARTSADCISYRLYAAAEGSTDAPRLLWSNRVYDRPEGHAGARRRAEQWCLAHGYRLVEERRRKRAKPAANLLDGERATVPPNNQVENRRPGSPIAFNEPGQWAQR
jgi:hypothetical protein